MRCARSCRGCREMSEYDADILVWSERQAALLRRLAAGERVDDPIDWENVVEEIESVGKDQLHAVRSLLVQALRNWLKAYLWELSREAPEWRSQLRLNCLLAAHRFTPSMRPRIDVEQLYADARAATPETIAGWKPLQRVPPKCPLSLDELLALCPP